MVDRIKKDYTKTVIRFGFLAVFGLMGLAMALSMATMNSANDEMTTLIEGNAQKSELAYHMRDNIRLRSSAIRSLLQINDPAEREKVFEKIANSTNSYIESRVALEAMGANAREQDILTRVEEADARVAEVYDKANNRIYSMANDPDKLKSVLGEVQLQEFVLLNHLNDLVQLEKTLAEETLLANQTRYKKMQRLLLV